MKIQTELNILMFTSGFPCNKLNANGGKFVLHEALSYGIAGAKVKVLTPHYNGAPEFEELSENVFIHRYRYFIHEKLENIVQPVNNTYDDKGALKIVIFPFFVMATLWHIFRSLRGINLVHCQWTPTVLFVLPFRKLFNFKLVVTPRGSDLRILPKWVNRLIMKKVDATVSCYGEGWHQTLSSFPSNFIELPLITRIIKKGKIPTELSAVFKTHPKAFNLVFLGRFDEIKESYYGYPITLLIKAVSKLLSEGHNLTLTYIGDGALESKIRDLIRDFKVEDYIYLLGPKNQPEEYLPYFNLGFGGGNTDAVAQEMAFAEIPQIQVDKLPDVSVSPWIDFENMLLFKPKDLNSLIEKIKFVKQNPESIKTLVQKSKDVIRNYAVGYEEGGKMYIDEFKKLANL